MNSWRHRIISLEKKQEDQLTFLSTLKYFLIRPGEPVLQIPGEAKAH